MPCIPNKFKDNILALHGTMRYSEIAQHLGITKNTVAGIIYRWCRKPSNGLYDRLNYDNNKGCRWIDADPKNKWHWCGSDTIEGKPYCLKHSARAYKVVISPEPLDKSDLR